MIAIHRGSDILLEVGVNQGSIRRFNLMKEDFIRLKFSLTTNTPLLIGDYVDLTGYINSCDNENFRIKDSIADQTTKKFVLDRNYYPTFNKDTGGWDYDVQINAYYHQWKNKIFMINPSKGAAESSFSITDTIFTHAALLVNNLKYAGFTYNNTEFNVAYQEEFEGQLQDKGMKPITYSAVSNYAALDLIAKAFECEWWLDGGSTIYFGYRKSDESITLTLNEEIADPSISDSDGVYATRIYAFGGTTNVPTHYRDKLVFEVNSYWFENGTIRGVKDSRKPVLSSYFRGGKSKADSRLLTISKATSSKGAFTAEEQTPDIAAVTSTNVVSIEAQTYDVDLSNLKINFKATHLVGAEAESTNLIEVGKDIDIRASVVATDGTNEDVIASEVKNIKIDRGTPTTSVAFTNSQREFKFVPSSIEIRVEVISAKWTYTKHMGDANRVDGKWKDYQLVQFEFSNEQAVISFQKSAQSAETIIRINGGAKDYTAIINPNYEDGGSNILITDYTGAWEDIKTYTFPNIVIGRVPPQYFSQEDGGVQNGVVQKNLMLPIGTNYVQADGVADANVVEAIMVYDWIYPKTALKVTKVEPFKEWKVEIEDGQTIDTTTYDITLPIEDYEDDLWVDPSQMFAIFQSGKAAGLRFELRLVSEKLTPTSVTFRLVPNEDYSITVPNEATIPAIDDEIILEGIDVSFLSGSAISEAENELLTQAQKDILETSKEDKVVDITLTSTDAYNRGRIALGTLTSLVGVLSSEDGAYDSRVLGFEECLDIPWDKPKYIIGDRNYYNRQASIETKLENIEKGSIILSGLNIGGGGSNIPIIKVKDSTKPTDANVYSALRSREEFAKRKEEETFSEKVTFNKDIYVKGSTKTKSLSVSNDANIGGNQSVGGNQTIQGKQTIGNNIDSFVQEVKGKQLLHGGFMTPNYSSVGGQIAGAQLTSAGLLTVAGLKAMSFEIFELIYNVIRAQGGTVTYSPCANIEKCIYVIDRGTEDHPDVLQLTPDEYYASYEGTPISYVLLTIKREEANKNAIPFRNGDILYGYVNQIGESGQYARGGQCVMHVISPDKEIGLDGSMVIKARLYSSAVTDNNGHQIVGNMPPTNGMTVAQRGNEKGTEGRTSAFFIDSSASNIIMLQNITTPVIGRGNYGVIIGQLPDDMLSVIPQSLPVGKHDPVVYAKNAIFENFIHLDHQGTPIPTARDRGQWDEKIATGDVNNRYKSEATYYDTVTHKGELWKCIVNNTTDEPSYTSTGWLLLVSRGDDGVADTIDTIEYAVSTTDSMSDIPTSWQEEKPHVTAGHYLWTKITYTPSGKVTYSTSYNGKDGASGKQIYIDSEVSTIIANTGTVITSSGSQQVQVVQDVSKSFVMTCIYDGKPVTPTSYNVSSSPYITSSMYLAELTVTVKIPVGTLVTKIPSSINVSMSVLDDDVTTTANFDVVIMQSQRGLDGPQGEAGPLYVPFGTWSKADATEGKYDVDTEKAQALPLVYYQPDKNERGEYYIHGGDNGKIKEGKAPKEDGSGWKWATSQPYLLADMLMANFAKLGSDYGAVFYHKYLFSQYGRPIGINGSTHYSDYFDTMFTKGDDPTLEGVFTPNIFFDFLTGAAKFGKLSESFIKVGIIEYDGGQKRMQPRYDIHLDDCHNVSVRPILSNADGTCVVVTPKSVEKSKRSIVDGTHCTIIHEYDLTYSMNLTSTDYSNSVVAVCADSSLCDSSKSAEFENIMRGANADGSEQITNGWFIWKGYRTKFILLAPGMMLKLRSCLMEDNGLVWFVENSGEFDILNTRMEMYADYNNNNVIAYELFCDPTTQPETLWKTPIIIGSPLLNKFAPENGYITSWIWDASGCIERDYSNGTNRYTGSYIKEQRHI